MKNHKTLTVIEKITQGLGSVPAILSAAALVFVWATVGLVAGIFVEDKYQLVINTTTTIITFLMVFVIQNSQNRDSQAVQAKLDEILRAQDQADDQTLVGIEDLPEKQIRKIKQERGPRKP